MEEDLLKLHNTLMYPAFLISVYSNYPNDSLRNNDYQTCYMEYHHVQKDGSYEEAVPVPQQVLENFSMLVANSLNLNHNYHGIVPKNLLYYHQVSKNIKMVWVTKPKIVTMFFAKDLKIPDGHYHVPGLVWSVNNNDLHIYAYKEYAGIETELFQGPFLNTSHSHFCIGSGKVNIKGNTYHHLLSAWENMMWSSCFSHASGTPTKTDIVKLYKNLGNNVFPLDELKPSDIKIKNLWVDEHINTDDYDLWDDLEDNMS